MIRPIDYRTCTHCSICFDICPMDCFAMREKQVVLAYPKDCMSCFLCEIQCPEGSIDVSADRARAVPLPY